MGSIADGAGEGEWAFDQGIVLMSRLVETSPHGNRTVGGCGPRITSACWFAFEFKESFAPRPPWPLLEKQFLLAHPIPVDTIASMRRLSGCAFPMQFVYAPPYGGRALSTQA
jgi:hypothetical protein